MLRLTKLDEYQIQLTNKTLGQSLARIKQLEGHEPIDQIDLQKQYDQMQYQLKHAADQFRSGVYSTDTPLYGVYMQALDQWLLAYHFNDHDEFKSQVQQFQGMLMLLLSDVKGHITWYEDALHDQKLIEMMQIDPQSDACIQAIDAHIHEWLNHQFDTYDVHDYFFKAVLNLDRDVSFSIGVFNQFDADLWTTQVPYEVRYVITTNADHEDAIQVVDFDRHDQLFKPQTLTSPMDLLDTGLHQMNFAQIRLYWVQNVLHTGKKLPTDQVLEDFKDPKNVASFKDWESKYVVSVGEAVKVLKSFDH